MPWIEKRGRTRVVRWKTYAPDGTVTVHASGRLTEPEADVMVAKLRATLPDRRLRKPGVRIVDPAIDSLCDQWAEEKAADPQSANYAAEACAKSKAVAAAAKITTLSQATGEAVRLLRKERGSPVERPLAYLRTILKWAQDTLGVEVDPRFYPASRPRPSRESEARLLTAEEAAAIEHRAKKLEQWPLVHCLMLYGWRPITACRILVGDVDLVEGRIRLRVKHQKNPHYHPLFPATIELLRPLLHDDKGKPLPAESRIFLSPSGIPWPVYGDEAKRLVTWYAERVKDIAPEAGGTNAMKRWALHRMERGLAPWPRILTLREIRLFTGHRTDSQATRYRRVSSPEAEALVRDGRGSSVVVVDRLGPIRGLLTALGVGHGDPEVDDSVAFSTQFN